MQDRCAYTYGRQPGLVWRRRSSTFRKLKRKSGSSSATIKSIAGSIDPKLFPTMTPLTAGFRKNVSQVEQIAAIISLLGGIAIFLAVVGLLGLVSYAVSQRTKEIAIRLAAGQPARELNQAEIDNLLGFDDGPSFELELACVQPAGAV